MKIPKKIRVAIIGSGKLGTDLLIKIMRSDYLECVLFAGRNKQSPGILKAMSLNVKVSCNSIHAIVEDSDNIDIVMDATSAEHHRAHAPIFKRLGIKAIDLTPAKVGPFCIPSINANAIFQYPNINLVTCGGQASIPLIHCLYEEGLKLTRVQVSSFLSKDSVGQGTIDNIDDYYASTARAIREYARVKDVQVKLSLERSSWKPDMLTIMRIDYKPNQNSDIFTALKERLTDIQKYVPGYHIVGTPRILDGSIDIKVSVRGVGDWLPAHAGNLDIINCAAISIAEQYAIACDTSPLRMGIA